MTKLGKGFLFLFSLICSGLFLYKAIECTINYMKFETVSKNSLQDQTLFPLPSICVASKFWVQSQLQKLGLTRKLYQAGKWNIPNMTEEELYDFASPRFEDLVTQIIVRAGIPNTDDWRSINIRTNMSEVEMKNRGMAITRPDSHTSLKTYCMEFVYEYGLQRVEIVVNNNTKVRFSISPPKSYNTYERKRNEILIVPGHAYRYQVHHKVLVSLPLSSNPCTHDMDFLEDDCGNDYINR